jgi:nucleoside-diphosphate-sugar epimerase
MRVFLTGANGFVGSALVPELLNAGHQVLGLVRSDEGVRSLLAAGAEAHRGDLADVESLRRGAAMSDGVIHTAFDHDFSKFAQTAEVDRRAIEALGDEFEGSDRSLIVTAGLPPTPDHVTTEEDVASAPAKNPRVSEQTATVLAARGVRASVVRMSQVHDRDRQGFATYMIALAREKGVSAYIGDGLNRWAAVHRLDTAAVYRLALEKGDAGAIYHAVAEEAVPLREVAEAIGQGLELPVVSLSPDEAAGHFGWLARVVGMDAPASSALTQAQLGWRPPSRPGFVADLERSSLFAA